MNGEFESESASSELESDSDDEDVTDSEYAGSSESDSHQSDSGSDLTECSCSDCAYSSLSDDSDSDSSATGSDSTDEEEHREQKHKAEFTTLLYDGADLTILESYLLLYQFALRHGMSKQALTDLVSLLNVHLPQQAKSAPSFYKLKQFFEQHFDDLESRIHYYCTNCHRLVDSDKSMCPNNCEAGVLQFVYLPVEPQLRRKLEDPFIWSLLQQRFLHSNDGVIRDIFDGQEYRMNADFLKGKANVTFTINVDGVSIYKSSKVEMWPIWLQINELPPSQRFSKHNMLLGGLWYSIKKPTMSTFLYPLIAALNSLHSNGTDVNTPEGQMKAHAMLVLCCVDLPAQALMLNMKSYNGKFACAWCEDPGVPRASCHMHRNWPFTSNNVDRTSQSIRESYQQLLDTGAETVMGIKGASVLFLHSPFNIVKGVAIDSLHTLFLGVVKDLLRHWFDKSRKSTSTSIYSKLKVCDSRLLSIKVPDRISRAPKTLEDYSHWKGSQLRDWLLYYSVPVLFGVLPPPLFDNYCLLVAGIHIVMADTISEADLSFAESCFEQFYRQYPTLYGPNAATMKCHLLRHTVQCVKQWGPVWAYSCFAFESMNHTIRKMFHGTQDASKELAFNHTLLQALPSVISIASCQNKVQVLLKKLQGNSRKLNDALLDQRGGTLLESERLLLNRQLRAQGMDEVAVAHRVAVGHRLIFDSELYYCSRYTRVKSRNSYTVKYDDGSRDAYGQIQFFVSVQNSWFAFILKLLPHSLSCKQHFQMAHNALDRISVSKIVPVITGNLTCVHVKLLVRKCVFIHINDSIGNCSYVVTFPNNLLTD